MFAAVLLQVTLTDHRVMFRTYPYTFTTDEAAKVMSSLVFIHVHRHPDPADPTRHIATRTTTTFSMDYDTARNMIQHFLSARLIMSATDPSNWTVRDRGLWCPTLKGKYIMEEFTDYTQVEMTQILIAALNAPYMSPGSSGSRVITLDRLTDNDDQITFSRPNMTAAFKAMMSSLPHDALLIDEIGGVDKKNMSVFQHTFVGSHCVEWLCDRLTVASKEEAEMVAAEFVLFGWIAQVLDKSDKGMSSRDDTMSFKTSRNAIYYVTDRGCTVIGWKAPKPNLMDETMMVQGDSSSGLSLDSDASSLSNNKKATSTTKKVVINTGKPPSINKVAATTTEPKYSNNAAIITTTATANFYQVNKKPTDDAIMTSIGMTRHDSATALIDHGFSPSSIDSSATSATGESIVLPRTNTLAAPRPTSMSFTDSSMSHTSSNSATVPPVLDNSQFTRLNQILETPLLRMYFRDFLRSNYCVENINFWVDHHILLKNSAKKTVLEQIQECYCIFETYLGPSASADVNIDHTLHQDIKKYASSVFVIVSQLPPSNIPYFLMTAASTTATKNHHKSAKSATRLLLLPPQVNNVKQRIITIRGTAPDKGLAKLLKMFERVNDHVCRMMAEDSVPKFVKTTKYKELMIQQERKALEDIDSDDESYDDDDYYDDSEDEDDREIIHLTTALADQRLSMELPSSRVDYSREGNSISS